MGQFALFLHSLFVERFKNVFLVVGFNSAALVSDFDSDSTLALSFHLNIPTHCDCCEGR